MDYKVIRSRRRTISVEIRNGELTVRAPLLLPNFAINKFIVDKAEWINKHLRASSKKNPISYGKIMINGVLLNLEFVAGPNKILKQTQKLIVSTSGKSVKLQNLKLKQYLIKETTSKIKQYLKKYENNFEVDFNFTVKMYKSKWGSCSPLNKLTFNGKLFMTPDEVIEYVVVHELCHTRVKNHSYRYWNEVVKVLPDYKKRRNWLRVNHHLLEYENR